MNKVQKFYPLIIIELNVPEDRGPVPKRLTHGELDNMSELLLKYGDDYKVCLFIDESSFYF
jgi:hypothetical protein